MFKQHSKFSDLFIPQQPLNINNKLLIFVIFALRSSGIYINIPHQLRTEIKNHSYMRILLLIHIAPHIHDVWWLVKNCFHQSMRDMHLPRTATKHRQYFESCTHIITIVNHSLERSIFQRRCTFTL